VVRCLVTGGRGFIGSHLVNYLKQKGHWVRSVDIMRESYLETKEDSFVHGDLRKPEVARYVTQDMDWVFNLAANMGGIGFITRVRADVVYDNVLISANMLRASVESGVKRFLFTSSACVYPKELQDDSSVISVLKEGDAFPAHPDTPYGWEKLFTEIMCKSFAEDYGLQVRIARNHNIYGPYCAYKGGREKAPAALCRKVAMAKDGGIITIWGDGKQIRSFLYIDDCVEAVYRLMLSDCDEPLNIGSEEAITVDELADMIIEISGKKLKKTYDLSKPVGVKSRNADLSLLKRILGWEPKVGYKEGLTKTYKWVEEQVISEMCGYA